MAGALVTLLLDVAAGIPSPPNASCTPLVTLSWGGALGAPRDPWWLGDLSVHQPDRGRLHTTPLACSSVWGPSGSRPIHLPPPWAEGAEAVAPGRGPGQALMVELRAAAFGPVLFLWLCWTPVLQLKPFAPCLCPRLLAAWESRRDVGPTACLVVDIPG